MEPLASSSHSTHKSIGVVGLGIIGRAVAAHLRRNRFPVYVWNRSPRPVPNFVGSPADLASLCDYIQIFVSNDEALLQTVEQLSADLAPRHIVLAHSTVAPDSMRAAAEIVERRGDPRGQQQRNHPYRSDRAGERDQDRNQHDYGGKRSGCGGGSGAGPGAGGAVGEIRRSNARQCQSFHYFSDETAEDARRRF
ncbi:MAG: hypothetical protein DME90_08075 [Verrucomicrobia bacterium]|nr:MAG: hypothetical protein DME90_08075 [Verrucomicrobiota bacterium]